MSGVNGRISGGRFNTTVWLPCSTRRSFGINEIPLIKISAIIAPILFPNVYMPEKRRCGASEQRLRLVDEGKLVELQLDGRAFDEDVSTNPRQGSAHCKYQELKN